MTARQPGIVGWLLEREDGVMVGTLLGTVASIFVSVSVTLTVLGVLGQFERSISVGLPIAILAPAIIAPLFFWVSLSLVVELALAREHLDRLTMIDQLTEVCNRSRFLELAAREVDNSRRYKYPVSLLIVDPDHLEDVNESYGYPSGDEVLRQIAAACQRTSREGDLVGRSSGKEFWVLLSHCGPQEAGIFGERLRVLVRSLIIDIGTCQITCTVSVGAVSAEGGTTSLDRLMSRANRVLKQAKRAGRNRVEVTALQPGATAEPQLPSTGASSARSSG